MSTHNICFHGEIRKISTLQGKKYTLSWYNRTLYVGNIVSLSFTDAFLLDNLSGIFDAIQISTLDLIHFACFYYGNIMGTVGDAYCLQTHFISFVHVVVIVPIFNAAWHRRHMDAASDVFIQPCFHGSPVLCSFWPLSITKYLPVHFILNPGHVE